MNSNLEFLSALATKHMVAQLTFQGDSGLIQKSVLTDYDSTYFLDLRRNKKRIKSEHLALAVLFRFRHQSYLVRFRKKMT